jgi:hypothetical protein
MLLGVDQSQKMSKIRGFFFHHKILPSNAKEKGAFSTNLRCKETKKKKKKTGVASFIVFIQFFSNNQSAPNNCVE